MEKRHASPVDMDTTTKEDNELMIWVTRLGEERIEYDSTTGKFSYYYPHGKKRRCIDFADGMRLCQGRRLRKIRGSNG